MVLCFTSTITHESVSGSLTTMSISPESNTAFTTFSLSPHTTFVSWMRISSIIRPNRVSMMRLSTASLRLSSASANSSSLLREHINAWAWQNLMPGWVTMVCSYSSTPPST